MSFLQSSLAFGSLGEKHSYIIYSKGSNLPLKRLQIWCCVIFNIDRHLAYSLIWSSLEEHNKDHSKSEYTALESIKQYVIKF